MEDKIVTISNLNGLLNAIQQANRFFLTQVQKQVNTSFTVRNWIIGYYLAEYEQKGKDRAEYGEQIIKNVSQRLQKAGIKGLSLTTLQLYKQFYYTYPQIAQTVPNHLQLIDFNDLKTLQTVSGESLTLQSLPISTLLNRLSFSHFIELIKADQPLKRIFYETETIQNNWSVRELQVSNKPSSIICNHFSLK